MDIGKTTPRLPEYRAGGASSVSKKSFRHAVRILKLSKSFKILLIERAVGFLPPAHTPRCSVSSVFCGVFQQSDMIGAFIVLTRCKRPFLLRMANGFAMPAPLPRGAGGRSTAERYWGQQRFVQASCKTPLRSRLSVSLGLQLLCSIPFPVCFGRPLVILQVCRFPPGAPRTAPAAYGSPPRKPRQLFPSHQAHPPRRLAPGQWFAGSPDVSGSGQPG